MFKIPLFFKFNKQISPFFNLHQEYLKFFGQFLNMTDAIELSLELLNYPDTSRTILN